MNSLQRALKVETALSTARANNKMGVDYYWNNDNCPCCTIGHALDALGVSQGTFRDFLARRFHTFNALENPYMMAFKIDPRL